MGILTLSILTSQFTRVPFLTKNDYKFTNLIFSYPPFQRIPLYIIAYYSLFGGETLVVSNVSPIQHLPRRNYPLERFAGQDGKQQLAKIIPGQRVTMGGT